ncbi:MAG: carbohydrate ABC transporter permease, partial [Actinobacteria bacterium]|nr:carbohydrate ABC transporter permease [Actinomycetota bacterium]
MSAVDVDAATLHRERIAEADRKGGRRGWRRYVPDPWHFVLFPLSMLMVIPFVWMLVTSFMTDAEINRFPPTLIPASLNTAGYTAVIAESD